MECSVKNCKSESVRKCSACKSIFCAIHWDDHRNEENIKMKNIDLMSKFEKDIW